MDGEPLGRGTELRIYLKEECQEYLDDAKLQDLIAKYSEFINFPIYLWVRVARVMVVDTMFFFLVSPQWLRHPPPLHPLTPSSPHTDKQ